MNFYDDTPAYLQTSSDVRRNIPTEPDVLILQAYELQLLVKPTHSLTDPEDYWSKTFWNSWLHNPDMKSAKKIHDFLFESVSNRLTERSGFYVYDLLQSGTLDLFKQFSTETRAVSATRIPASLPQKLMGLQILGNPPLSFHI